MGRGVAVCTTLLFAMTGGFTPLYCHAPLKWSLLTMVLYDDCKKLLSDAAVPAVPCRTPPDIMNLYVVFIENRTTEIFDSVC